MPPEPNCFVICPIGDKHAEVGSERRLVWEWATELWEQVIAPACQGVGLVPAHAGHINEPGDITEQIMRRLRDAPVVIADLTGANPNVMYELGLRHSTPKLTVQIGEAGSLPFDVAAIRTILFKRTPGGLIEARRALVESLVAGLRGRFSPVAATRIWLESEPPFEQSDTEHSRRDADDNTQEDSDEPGRLEVLAEMEVALGDITTTLMASAGVANEITEAMSWATAQVENLSGTRTASARVPIANDLAARLQEPVVRFEALSRAFRDAVRRSDGGVRILIRAAAETEDERLCLFRETLVSGIGALLNALAAVERLGVIAGSSLDATKSLRRIMLRIGRASTEQVSAREALQEWLTLVQD